MILENKDSLDYLYKFQEGKIKLGLGINTELDSFIRYKQGNFNVIVGLDNVGKTAWILYYFLCLTKHHKIKHIITGTTLKPQTGKVWIIPYISKLHFMSKY